MAFGTAALIVAAGTGTRVMGSDVPKQYRSIAGKPVLLWSLEAFANHPGVDHILPVIADTDRDRFAGLGFISHKLMKPIVGGATRQESVMAGLTKLATDPPGRVLIHDAARPFVSSALIDRVLDALRDEAAAVPALPVTNSLKRVDRGHVVGT